MHFRPLDLLHVLVLLSNVVFWWRSHALLRPGNACFFEFLIGGGLGGRGGVVRRWEETSAGQIVGIL